MRRTSHKQTVDVKRQRSCPSRVGTRFSFLPLACLSLCAVVLGGAGCNTNPPKPSGAQIELTLDPSQPVVGDADVTLKLTDIQGQPLQGADVRLEGNMNHAGMKPSFAELKELSPGQYQGKLEFTMGGDWFLLVSARTADGDYLEQKVEVPGVKAN